jgi:hypothetical protein
VTVAAVAATLVAGLMAAPASAARPTPGVAYRTGAGGNTAVAFRVSRTGRSMDNIRVSAFVTCPGEREGLASFYSDLEDRPPRLRIASDGTFSGSFSASEELLDPFVASENFLLSGRFIRNGRAARITVRARMVGEGGTECDTGNRRRTVNRARRASRRSPAVTGSLPGGPSLARPSLAGAS